MLNILLRRKPNLLAMKTHEAFLSLGAHNWSVNLLSRAHFHLNPAAETSLLFASIAENTGKHSEQILVCLMVFYGLFTSLYSVLAAATSPDAEPTH